MSSRLLAAVAITASLYGAAHAAPAPSYVLTNLLAADAALGAPGFPFGINQSGQIIGAMMDGAFFYDTRTGEARTVRAPGTDYTNLLAINQAGVAVGASGLVLPGKSVPGRAQVYDSRDGSFRYVGNGVSAADINARGQILYEDGGDVYLDDGGTATRITNRGSFPVDFVYRPEALTDNGKLLVERRIPGILNSAYHLYDSTGRQIRTLEIGGGSARALNEAGQVVGHGGDDYAFITGPDGVSVISLGALAGDTSSFATGINNLGEVVGDSVGAHGVRGFLSSGGQMVDLNHLSGVAGSGWTVVRAMDITDDGRILAWGSNADGVFTTLLLSPVPEPHTGALTLLAAAGVFAAVRRGSGAAGA